VIWFNRYVPTARQKTTTDLPTAEQLAHLPLFPLPQLVFFPHTVLPLHVFEVRYREMTEWCLEHEWPMAVVMIEPGHEGEQLGDPPLAEIATVGQIIEHELLEDGRINLVLQGTARVRLVEHRKRKTSYRIARCELLPLHQPDDPGLLDATMETLRSSLTTMCIRWQSAPDGLLEWLLNSADAITLTNRLASAFFVDGAIQQEILAIDDIMERVDRVQGRIAEILAGTMRDSEPIH
jgi:Lon protease-like protein